MNNHFLFKCIDCDSEFQPDRLYYLCPNCSDETSNPPKGVLKIIYPYEELKRTINSVEQIIKSFYKGLTPILNSQSLPNLRIGNTPLYQLNKLKSVELDFELYLKDDSQNPTFSFKDRASSWVSAHAKENDQNTIVTASTGNAGSSLAGICAAQQQKAIVIVPASAPIAKLTQIMMYGATIVPVAGTYDDAIELSLQATTEFGWYNRNTAFNPVTIEGKKTVAFEILAQLKDQVPDRIFVPVGDGVIISGVYKGFEDLLKLELISKMPIVVAIQSEGSDNLVRNIDRNDFEVKESKTLADSISVDYPRNFYMARNFIKKYNGEWISISDKEIIEAGSLLARETGVFTEPAAAAAFAGFLNLHNKDKISRNSKNVVLLTGSGLKDLSAYSGAISPPKPVEPNIAELKRFLKG